MLKREGAGDVWHDHRIVPGDDIDAEIEEALERSDVILLLCSPDFLHSGYCYDREAQRAMERHAEGSARVLPVILRDCEWRRAPFGKLKATPPDGKPVVKWPDLDEVLKRVVEDIRAAIEASPGARPRAAAAPARARATRAGLPRSANLRVRQEFTDADKDTFRDEAFEFMARYFEGSLDELAKRNPGIKTKFRRIDARSFTAVVYRGGEAVSRCRIALGGGYDGNGITYSSSDSAHDNSFNASLTVEEGEQMLHLAPLFGGHWDEKPRLTHEGAAEHYWEMLIERLQR